MRARRLSGLRRITEGTDKRGLSVDQISELPPTLAGGVSCTPIVPSALEKS